MSMDSVKLEKWPSAKDGVNSHQERINVIKSTIDTLFDIKLSLNVKKIISPTIKRSELNKIVNAAKQRVDDLVSKEIDKVFDEYLNINEKVNTKSNEDDTVLLSNAQSEIDNKILSLEEMKKNIESGSGIGNSKVLSNGHYNNHEFDITSTAA